MKTAIAAIALTFAAAPAWAANRPVVVELFQSQGCSSCPPADANLNAIAGRADVLALNFGVTYWDQLGWKDTFAQPAFTARQKAYAASLRAPLGTPEMVVEGRDSYLGVDPREVAGALRAARPANLTEIASANGHVRLAPGQGLGRPADVWLIRYDPRVQQVAIQRGENGGRTLPHKNTVRQLVRLGAWNGAAADFAAPALPDPAFKTAVLVQAPGGGPILAAAKLD
jgi:hypothetical protein